MKSRRFLTVLVVLALTPSTVNASVYLSLDGVSPAPNDVNIVAGSNMSLYIVSDDSNHYMVYWGTYWGTQFGTNWGNHWDRPWEQVSMSLPLELPAAGDLVNVRDISFSPEFGTSWDYECSAGGTFIYPATPGPHFSTVITAIGAADDKFGIEILEGEDPYPRIQEIVFTIVNPCDNPLTLTVNAEPNNIDINSVTPSVGEHEYCPDWTISLKAETFHVCPAVYRFDHWIGDVNDPNSPSTTVVMDSNEIVTAVFVDDRRCGDECHPILQGDLNADCYINMVDFALYCEQWLSCTHPDCDPNTEP